MLFLQHMEKNICFFFVFFSTEKSKNSIL